MIYLIIGLSVLIVMLTVLMYLLNSKKIAKIQKHAPIVGKVLSSSFGEAGRGNRTS